MTPTMRAVPTGDTRVQGIRIMAFNNETTLNISGYEDSGSGLTFYPWYEAVCIIPY